jgi:hypothetical protein
MIKVSSFVEKFEDVEKGTLLTQEDIPHLPVVTYLTRAEYDSIPNPKPMGQYCIIDGDDTPVRLPNVQTEADLPPPDSLDHTKKYVCRVENDPDPANNGDWQLIPGGDTWVYLSDFIDADQLAAAIEAEAEARNIAIAQAKLALQIWLPAVDTKAQLPDPAALDPTINYLCRVIADPAPENNGVWQLIAGTDEWTYFSDNTDFVDEIELNTVINAEVINRNTAIWQAVNEEATARDNEIKGAVETILEDAAESDALPSTLNSTFAALFQTVRNFLKNVKLHGLFKSSSPGFVKNDGSINYPSKWDVGLGNVDNTADANKPVSTAQAEAINTEVTDRNIAIGAAIDAEEEARDTAIAAAVETTLTDAPASDALPPTTLTGFAALLQSIRNVIKYLKANAFYAAFNGYDWVEIRAGLENATLAKVAYGDGKYVVVGAAGIIACSVDGVNWTKQVVGSTSISWSAVCYGGGKFVAHGTPNTVAYSTDGINWTTQTVTISGAWDIAYGNNLFVAGQANATTLYSSDGITWNSATTPVSNFRGAGFGNGKFMLGTSTGYIITSTDAVNWTQVARPFTSTVRDLYYANGIWLATADSNKIAYSLDEGVTWETTAALSIDAWYSVTYGEGRFIATSTNGYFSISTDGINWTVGPQRTGQMLRSIVYSGSVFLATNNKNTGPGVLISRLPFVKTDGSKGYPTAADIAAVGVANTGSLSALTTTDKSSLVAAINEINARLNQA